MRGATLFDHQNQNYHDISIHAPHAGRDNDIAVLRKRLNISIHAPHAGRDAYIPNFIV